ncbi:phage prohead protease protein [Cellulophaga phage phi18:2]|uniref:Phage prohead protease protein n=2 Tax=Cellulophaga phage phi18:1 TaxID=1327982 RepID=S0A0V3_9CAUD|nr:phage prohead protease protein [Cellulophaga phage phi18:1]AGO48495.1 phage prohead protease protein [Cellulophaga phage phi18:1]AGO49209.1 phage prohead protease protein [Cellulophaga phage phi18:2]
MQMEFKRFGTEIKDFDPKKGIVSAFANAYNNEDAAGDISDPSSFKKTVKENYKRIRVLKDHDTRVSLGVPKEIDTNNPYGLWTVSQFNMNKEVSRDMFTDIELMVENGLHAELSIGYDVIERDQKNRNLIKQYALWEYSFLSSWACNELARVGDIKSLQTVPGLVDLIQKSYNLDYSDTRLRQIEQLLKSLPSGPLDPSTLDVKPTDSKTIAELIINTYKNV